MNYISRICLSPWVLYTVDSQKIVQSKFCELTENRFLRFLSLRTRSASYTLKVAALIITNFNFAPEALYNYIYAKIKLARSFPNFQYLWLEYGTRGESHECCDS